MTTSHIQSTTRTYARSSYSNAVVCGSRNATQFYIYDRSAWETFEPADLPEYLTEGAEKAAAHLERIAYLDHPYTEQDEQNLRFMVEALLQARRAADELISTR
ncbi:MAG: hypothetical protein JWM39_378 [Parcubacteria group bacterium]|jgi:hypothetical protein|nr:hypothetical protein [Parcubacteria group bacterium]